jgi:hypothetical protein
MVPTKKRTDGVVWEEPPDRGIAKDRVSHYQRASVLRSRPREWGIVSTYTTSSIAASIAQSIRRGTTAAWRPVGAYEAMARTVKGEHRVYARYVGGGEG